LRPVSLFLIHVFVFIHIFCETGNTFGDRVSKELARTLRAMTALRSLSIRDCRSVDTEALLENLILNRSLSSTFAKLSLANLELNSTARSSLPEFVALSTNLEALDLNGTSLGTEDAVAIVRAVLSNASIKGLNLRMSALRVCDTIISVKLRA
jgi:Ran GTPase-activating protein (RanGAP) involved in mRNA processing and transport